MSPILQLLLELCILITAAKLAGLISSKLGQPAVLGEILAGLLLGSRWGLASVAVYLLAGIVGLPVFAGGTGGIGRIVGPTGGFLLGYLPVVFLVGRMAERLPRRMAWDVAAMTAGAMVLYACGVAWLSAVTGLPFGKALALGMVPFLPGDALKIAAAALIARAVRPVMNP